MAGEVSGAPALRDVPQTSEGAPSFTLKPPAARQESSHEIKQMRNFYINLFSRHVSCLLVSTVLKYYLNLITQLFNMFVADVSR